MVRIFLSLLLAVILLVCPLRCVSCCAAESVVNQAASPACCCCPQDCELPSSDVPADHSRVECSCQNCICEGAALENTPKVPDSTSVAALVALLPVDEHVGGLVHESFRVQDRNNALRQK